MTSNADRSGSFLRKIGAVPAKKTTTKAKTPVKSTAKEFPLADTIAKMDTGPALQFIELGKIRALDQVRTEFNDQDLRELAASIQQQGMLQPVLLRPDPDTIDQFIIIAGERRVRAAHLAGLSAVPAMVGQVDLAKAAEMQLVENIQREELGLMETAKAVAQLYAKHQALRPIAALVGKSLAWVSKHLAAGTKLGWRSRRLMDTGKCEDLELLLTVSQIEAIAGYNHWDKPQEKLLRDIEAGTAGRTEAREMLAQLKDKQKADKKAATKKKATTAAKKNEPPPWTAYGAMSELYDKFDNANFDLDEVLASYTPDQQQQMVALVRKHWEAGNVGAAADKMTSMRRIAAYTQTGYPDSEDLAAYILGANSIELSLRDLVIEWRAIAG